MLKRVLRLYAMARESRGRMIGGLVLLSAANLLAVVLNANLFGGVVAGITAGSAGEIGRALLWALPPLLGILLCGSAGSYLTDRATSLAGAGMRKRLMLGMLTATLAHSLKRDSGTKLSYFSNDVPVATQSLCDALYIPIRSIVTGAGAFGYILWVSPLLALILLGCGGFVLLFSLLCSKQLYLASVRVQGSLAEMARELKNHLDGILAARIDGMRDFFEGKFLAASQTATRDGIQKAVISAVLGCLNNFSHAAGEGIIILCAGLLYFGGQLEFPALFQVTQVAGSAVSLFFVARALVQIQECLAGAQRVFDELDSLEAERSGTQKPDRAAQPVIAFEQVSFAYGEGPAVMEGMSFAVEQGEFVALMGTSGSGKTTALRLVQGLFSPASGQVKVNGVDTRDWDLPALRRRTALVAQDHLLFTGTIGENIAMGVPNASREAIEAAAKRAEIHEFISTLPLGYDTPVEEKGRSLSGGQRQRIAIARALLCGADILLLDEVTSALDPKSDERILETLAGLRGEKTILMVAHKKNALALADRRVDFTPSYLTKRAGGATIGVRK